MKRARVVKRNSMQAIAIKGDVWWPNDEGGNVEVLPVDGEVMLRVVIGGNAATVSGPALRALGQAIVRATTPKRSKKR